MKRILLVSIILVAMLLSACATPATTPTPSPIPTPATTSTPRDIFTIRVTGSRLAFNQEEYDRRLALNMAEYKRYLDDLFAKRDTTWYHSSPVKMDDLYTQVPDVKFSGSYMVITSGGQTTSRSVDGTTPAEYTVQGSIVSCVFQKADKGGSLTVNIIKGGKVVASEHTTADYGVVSIATQ